MQNTSGYEPVDVRLVVQPDDATKVSKGGVIMPDTVQQKEQFASTKATVIAVGDNVGADWGENARKPQPGERILMAQYAGTNVKGADDKDYRVINDEDVCAILKEATNG